MTRKLTPCVIAPAGELRTAFNEEALIIGGIWEAFPDCPKFWVCRKRDGWGQTLERTPWIVVLNGDVPDGMLELFSEAGGYYLEPVNLGLPLGVADGFDGEAEPTDGPVGYEKMAGVRDGCPYFTIPAHRTRNVIRALREHRVLIN